MKLKSFLVLLLLSTSTAKISAAKEENNLPAQNPLSFTENKGQFADQNYRSRPDILFGGSDGEMTFYITGSGISYQQYRVDSYTETLDPKTKEKRKETAQQTIYRTDIKWVNANADPLITTDAALPGYNNYYLEQCPNGALEVKSYKGITLQNIYNNIDLHYYANVRRLKCDYIVAPHADYTQIQLKVEGATVSLNNDGNLLLETPLGKIQEQAPVVYQNGRKLEAHYTVNNNQIGFVVDNYDSNYELIIDPVTRLWGTYYGGTSDDLCTSTKTDASGDVFVAGHSSSSTGTAIATTGSHQNIFAGGLFDAFLVKFSFNGVRAWGTYYGGSGSDFSTCFAIDGTGNLFMTGYTSSNSGTAIATAGSHQSAFGGGSYDGYLVQFNSSGVRLWASYYGGSGIDVGNSCSIDASGNVYMAGYSASSTGTVIASAGSHQSSNAGGTYDAYLVKFTNSGVRTWATYYGGTANDVAYACATDASGNIYMSGHSSSSGGTVIATSGSHQTAISGGDDGFLVKFNSSGVRQWGTYYGSTANENVYGCATDASGNVFIAGHTASNASAVFATAGCHQSNFGGAWDMFVVKFNGSGVRSWGTYYGDTGSDLCWSCNTNTFGDVFLVGYAGNSTGATIATPGSHQTTYGGGTYDACMVKFYSNGIRAWGTYYGGTGDDAGGSGTDDGSGHVYMVGSTDSNTGTEIATAGSHQSTLAGAKDAFLVRFVDCNLHTASFIDPVCAGGTLSLSANSAGTLNPSYDWAGPNSFTSSVQNPTIGNASAANLGFYTLTLHYNTCIEVTTVQISILNPQPTVTVNSGTICPGNKFVIVPSGASTYTISGGTFTVSPANTTSYSVTGTNTVGCVSGAAVSTVSVGICTGLNEYGADNSQFVKIYPNPNSGKLTIESTENAKVNVFDLRGRLVDEFNITSGTNSVSVEHLENGIYLMEIADGHSKQVLRVIKQ